VVAGRRIEELRDYLDEKGEIGWYGLNFPLLKVWLEEITAQLPVGLSGMIPICLSMLSLDRWQRPTASQLVLKIFKEQWKEKGKSGIKLMGKCGSHRMDDQ
jgi:hypothetical protein